MLEHHNIGDYDGLGMWLGRRGQGMFAEFDGEISQKLLLERQKGNRKIILRWTLRKQVVRMRCGWS
jgi:hypothetical protein